jgi:hypothetical protein
LIQREDRFTDRFKNQLDISRSQLSAGRSGNDLFAVEYIDKKLVRFRQTSGFVYFFKYKATRDEDWEIGISGLQPINPSEVDTGTELVKLTNKRIKPDHSVIEQFNDQLNRLLLSKHKSAASFYLDNDYYPVRGEDEE